MATMHRLWWTVLLYPRSNVQVGLYWWWLQLGWWWLFNVSGPIQLHLTVWRISRYYRMYDTREFTVPSRNGRYRRYAQITFANPGEYVAQPDPERSA